MGAEVQAKLDTAYGAWAKQLLGFDPWRSSAVAIGEVGWDLSGFARVVLDIAVLRCKFWKECNSTLAGKTFLQAHGMLGLTWARKSYHLLASWGVLDWPDWQVQSKTTDTYSSYVRRSLRRRCLTDWALAVAPHSWPIPYSDIVAKPTNLFQSAFRAGLHWETLVQQRALSQLRCGQLALGHIGGRRSRAKYRQCLFCNKWYSSMYYHVVCSCEYFADERSHLTSAKVDVSSLRCLATDPDDPSYPAVANFACAVQSQTAKFWKSK